MSKPITQSTGARITATADRLFYENGFAPTSFADIANEMHISRGNFYHHFRSKDAILDSVITARRANTRALLAQWENDEQSPDGRVRAFIQILITNQTNIMRFGCPVGSLCSELAKLNNTAQSGAAAIFSLFCDWLEAQFIQLGHQHTAKELAMHLLARTQGIAVMAQAFSDRSFIATEVDNLKTWLADLSQ